MCGATSGVCRAELAVDEAAEKLAREQGGKVFTDAVEWAEEAVLALTARVDFEGAARRHPDGMQHCRRRSDALFAMPRLHVLRLPWVAQLRSRCTAANNSMLLSAHCCAAERDDIAVSRWAAAGREGARRKRCDAG